MISYEHPNFWGLAIFLVLVIAGVWFGSFMQNRQKAKATDESPELDLSDPQTRERMERFLARANISGNADIREGQVLPVIPADRLDPLIRLLAGSSHLVHHLQNPAADALYIRGKGGELRHTGIDLTDILDAARMMQHMAEKAKES